MIKRNKKIGRKYRERKGVAIEEREKRKEEERVTFHNDENASMYAQHLQKCHYV